MADLSRRRLLIAGGAVSAAALTTPLWTWPAAASVAGAGVGADPATVWDPEADRVVADLIQHGDVDAVNDALRGWTRNDQPTPIELPGDLYAFIESARRLPSWADSAKLADAFEFTQRWGLYLGVLYGMNSGMMSTAIPREARAVYYSYGGSDMRDRIKKTAKLGYDIGVNGAYGPAGEMIVTCVKTRLIHAAVRHLLPQSPHWVAAADEEIPISQRDIMVTWHSLASSVWQKLDEWEVERPADLAEGYLHVWQVTAHMLGVRDEYIPATWADALSQREQVLVPLLAPTEEGVALADILLDFGAEIDGTLFTRPALESMSRFMLGDQVAEWLELPRHPALDTTIKVGWPVFVAFRESGQPLSLAPPTYWMFDEFLRKAVLLFLARGEQISIEIPTGNNPNYPS